MFGSLLLSKRSGSFGDEGQGVTIAGYVYKVCDE